jgi:hypothetical protein
MGLLLVRVSKNVQNLDKKKLFVNHPYRQMQSAIDVSEFDTRIWRGNSDTLGNGHGGMPGEGAGWGLL